jgi:hypothetical protein
VPLDAFALLPFPLATIHQADRKKVEFLSCKLVMLSFSISQCVKCQSLEILLVRTQSPDRNMVGVGETHLIIGMIMIIKVRTTHFLNRSPLQNNTYV